MNILKKTRASPWGLSVILILALYDLGLGWWNNIPPKRPRTVPPDSVFLFGLPVGAPFPIAKRGDWLNCWLDGAQNVNRCRVANVDGTFEFEGPFLRFEGVGPVSQNALQIDIKATDNKQEWIFFRGELVPLVHLRDGTILIPAEDYEAGKQKLEWVNEHQKQ
jgi:hypothetical protein